MNLSGCWLKVIEKTNLLPVGEIVYCFVQEESQFRVQTRRLIHGVDQVIFSNSSWDKFRVVP